MNLRNQIAVVTGAGRGIGRVIALRLAREGARVVAVGLQEDELRRTVADIAAAGGQGLSVVADVRDEAQVADMAAAAQAAFGKIDVLVNNAAIIGPTAPVADIALAEWNDVLAVNLTGGFLCARAVLPGMMARRCGKIIHVSSIAGKMAYALRSPYAVSKWGLIGLTLTMAKELGPYNIQVNAICPGPVTGERMRQVIEQRAAELGQPVEQVEQAYVQTTVLRRLVCADDVAALAAFLASSDADNITGQALDVTAGYGL